jgi:hypothetical protein
MKAEKWVKAIAAVADADTTTKALTHTFNFLDYSFLCTRQNLLSKQVLIEFRARYEVNSFVDYHFWNTYNVLFRVQVVEFGGFYHICFNVVEFNCKFMCYNGSL